MPQPSFLLCLLAALSSTLSAQGPQTHRVTLPLQPASLDLETGAVIKSDRLPVGGEYAGSPIAADDKLYLPTSAGELVVTTADGDWEVLAVNELGEDLAASPAARDGSLYVRTLTHLHCFEQLDG